ncbi:2-dehydropantoate 2-reductase [Nannizzia gypsea CBS 118893]|uniref:2-dehydropantoate 2-reductase n=1 Tax=Arthroderma gypseum (strain ATCC MYA-4604 / CBS 118893) TaxID=535722 RepID=E4UWF5_ARTGP|nr:2-dehydropantoate 2-reductase [Nannizzia gypsea CBS 118893]EFR02550.1 2-dehydropantoate 2-reductase [Nannizzia gypsea CBS 118893]
MGVGNIGSFVAHSLAARPISERARLTLLFHHPAFYKDWNRYGRVVAVKRHGIAEQRSGFSINVLQDQEWYYPSEIEGAPNELVEEEFALREGDRLDSDGHPIPANEEWIEHLIVTVKTTQIEKAMKSVRHRLTPESSVLFLTNGLGVLEEVNEKIWPDESKRPNYLFGVTSHGLFKSGLFETTHAGVGTTSIGVVRQSPRDDTEEDAAADATSTALAPSTNYLLNTLTQTPELACVSTNATDLLLLQLEKLAVNCVINPLTLLMDCKNGELLYHYNLTRAQRLLLIEVSTVICALPELQGVPGLRSRFSPERLRTLAVGVAGRTAENTSSMLQDARMGKESEIEYMNGYIVRRGEEVGVRCALNYMVVQLVQAKSRISGRKRDEEVPFDLSKL